MADAKTDFDSAIPMNDAAADEQAATRADFDHAIPMSDATADEQAADLSADRPGKVAEVKQAAKDTAGKFTAQATEKARLFAEDGKARAGGALDQLAQLLTDAAGQVDEKLGAQYGAYARQAASSVTGFSDQVKAKDLDALLEDARGFVRASPAVAVGVAAALGFVVARLVQSGLDDARG